MKTTRQRNQRPAAHFHPRRSNSKCRSCGKVSWKTQLDAKMALADCGSARASAERNEIRTYRCPKGNWHLTSMEYRPRG